LTIAYRVRRSTSFTSLFLEAGSKIAETCQMVRELLAYHHHPLMRTEIHNSTSTHLPLFNSSTVLS
jgi:hypothetical protein